MNVVECVLKQFFIQEIRMHWNACFENGRQTYFTTVVSSKWLAHKTFTYVS